MLAPALSGGACIVPKLAVIFSLIALAVAGGIAYFERSYVQLAMLLEQDLAAARAFRWERPVLRGAIGDGNAADDIYAALGEWRPLGSVMRRAIAEKVYFGQPLEAAEASALAARDVALHALRAAVQQRWSHTELAPERGAQMLVPDYPKLTEAAISLLADARARSPEGCLQEAVDVIRIGQDLVPSAPLEAVSVQSRLIAFSARVIARCALTAELGTLRKITHELRVLASHPPPTGSALELEELAHGAELRERAALTGKGPVQVAQTLLERPQLLAAWRRSGSPRRFRDWSAERYPSALEEWRHEQDLRSREGADEARTAAEVHRRIQDDVRAQALLRMTCVAVSALAERAYRGTLPQKPSALSDAGLVDPFRGQPFRFRLANNGAEFTLWSVGPDAHDDEGSDQASEFGPRDVTMHVALR